MPPPSIPVFLGATVTFRDLRLRLQCPLTLNGAHRACDLRLQFQILEINNAEGTGTESVQSSSLSTTTAVTSSHYGHRRERHKTLPKAATTPPVEHAESTGNLWSWFWSKTWIFGLSKNLTA